MPADEAKGLHLHNGLEAQVLRRGRLDWKSRHECDVFRAAVEAKAK